MKKTTNHTENIKKGPNDIDERTNIIGVRTMIKTIDRGTDKQAIMIDLLLRMRKFGMSKNDHETMTIEDMKKYQENIRIITEQTKNTDRRKKRILLKETKKYKNNNRHKLVKNSWIIGATFLTNKNLLNFIDFVCIFCWLLIYHLINLLSQSYDLL